eukprot:09852.XXX_245277_245396_1 [CDS] Oithona nana genome sequencing.
MFLVSNLRTFGDNFLVFVGRRFLFHLDITVGSLHAKIFL